MCTWHRVDVELPPFAVINTGHDSGESFSDWYMVVYHNDKRWDKARYCSFDGDTYWQSHDDITLERVTHWASVELPGD